MPLSLGGLRCRAERDPKWGLRRECLNSHPHLADGQVAAVQIGQVGLVQPEGALDRVLVI